MSGTSPLEPTKVGLSAMAVASGVVQQGGAWFARVTLVLHPSLSSIAGTQTKLSQWPSRIDDGQDGVHLMLAPGDQLPHDDPRPVLVPAQRRDLDQPRILDLWSAILDHPLDWVEIARAFDASCAPPPARPQTVITPPHSEAALAYSLLRGRAVLERMAAPGAPILAFQPPRTPIRLAAGRPWLRRPEPDVQLASLEGTATDATPDPHRWLRPYRDATAALFQDRAPDPFFPAPRRFAQAALGQAGDTLDDTIDRIQAAHHYATPAQDTGTKPAPTDAETREQNAQRRVGALMALPTLQRLFGLAHDILVPIETIRNQTDANGLMVLALADDPRCWTLARLSGHHFAPASRAEAAALQQTPLDPSTAETWGGLRNLGQSSAQGPRYDICTMDPVLAAESDLSISESGSAEPGQLPDLRQGGLRLLDRDRFGHAVQELRTAEGVQATATACVRDGTRILRDADELQAGDRLLVGIRRPDGMAWRVPQYRHITFTDPARPREQPGWVEGELSKLGLPAGSARRLELDCATLHQPMMSLPNPTAPGASPAELDRLFESDQSTLLADCTLAAWGGEPMGVAPSFYQEKPDKLGYFHKTVEVNDVRGELDITRRFSAPGAGDPAEHLSPILRFGYPYHLAVVRTFVGGASVTPAEAAAAIADITCLALPPTRSAPGMVEHGRRMLRHETVHAPTVAFPAQHRRHLAHTSPRQDGAAMVVRTTSSNGTLPTSRRMLLPPEVPMFFAMLHDVLPAFGQPALNGLVAFTLTHTDKSHPQVLDIGQAAAQLFIPDPAAHTLVLRLRRPDAQGDDAWLEEPIEIPLSGTWPDTSPVEVTLRAVAARATSRVVLNKQRTLGPGADPVEPGDAITGSVPTVSIPQVTICLAPSEQAVLEAWFVPTASQLARWFDACEAAAILATEAGSADARGSAAACVAGLRQLLQQQSPALPPHTGASAPVCTGAASLPTAPPAQLLQLAQMLRQTMLRHPVAQIAVPLPMTLTHAVDPSAVPTAELQPSPILLRRNLVADASALAFLGRGSADWSQAMSQASATGVLFGGTLSIDAAATASVIVEGSCLAPDSETLVPADLKTNAVPHVFELLRIDGIPPPADARAGRVPRNLLQLLTAALGPAKPFGPALRAAISGNPATHGARRLRLRVVAHARHAGLMPGSAPQQPVRSRWSAPLWLPATKRPAQPAVDRLQQILVSKPLPNGWERRSVIRIWLGKSWYSSGEDERLGIVLWPPNVFATGASSDDQMKPIDRAVFTDGDLGEGGAYVSRWGGDATRDGAAPQGPLLLPATFGFPAHQQARVSSEPDFEPEPEFVPRAWMPIAAETALGFVDPPGDAERQESAAEYLAVALLTFTPHKEDGTFFVDLPIDTEIYPRPRVRLGLVRYQKHAREDDLPIEGEEPVRLRVSTPIREFIQPLPLRTATARVDNGPGASIGVIAVLRGVAADRLDAGVGKVVVSMSLRRRSDISGREQPVLDDDGRPLELATSTGNILRSRDGTASVWTGMFALKQGFVPGWRYAVIMREWEEMRPATPLPEAPADALVATGDRFIARIELTA